MLDHDTVTALKQVGDVAAVSVAGLSLFNILPAIAIVLSIIWTATRLYEAFTGKPFSTSKLARWLTGRD
jgi:hypothetical protein